MTHNLFLVHGMGVHDNDSWADDVKSKLQEVSKRYEFFQNKNIEDHVNFFPISYDEKLRELLELWKNNVADMQSFFNNNDLKDDFKSEKILSWFENADDLDKNFFWSHIADVLIYRFFLTYQASIRVNVAKQFVKGINWINENNPDHKSRSILTHSLGNIVAHDALHMLGNSMFTDVEAFTPEDGKFQVLFSLANVSRIMKSDFDPYNSIIRPLSAGDESFFNAHFNYYHKLDPFTVPQRFSPDNWGNGFKDRILNHYHSWNIHGFDHFLDNPNVHIPLLQIIIEENCISPHEKEKAYDAYKNENQFGGDLKCIGEVKNIIDNDLKPLIQGIEDNINVHDFAITGLKAYKIFNKIKLKIEECDETD